MGENWRLTQEALDKFLHWLDQDQVEAGTKYELIRRHLIFILTRRGCWEPEDLADETINRVARRVVEGLAETYRGDPTPYLITVARNLYLEHLETRKRERESFQNLPDPEPPDPDKERADGCLTQCLRTLTEANSNLVLRFYKEDRQSKIDDRKRLAEELGISVNALRIRAFRIRAVLEQCIADCLGTA
jgi:DNA-directed RNA polymerase specialized sigma24 family protein